MAYQVLDARNGTTGGTLTTGNMPAQQMTIGTGGSATWAEPAGMPANVTRAYRFVAPGGQATFARVQVPHSKVQALRFLFYVPVPATLTADRTLLMPRVGTDASVTASTGPSHRWRIGANTRRLIIEDAAGVDIGTGPILATGQWYEAAATYDIGSSATTGSITVNVYNPGGTTPLADGGTITLTGRNLGATAADTKVTHYDIGSNDSAVAAFEGYYSNFQTENDRTTMLPVYNPDAVVPPTLPDGPWGVVLLTGSTNMRGSATDYDPTGQDAYPANVWQLATSGPNNGQVIPAVEPLWHGDASRGMGPASAFVKALRASGDTRPILVVPAARSGTGYEVDPAATEALSWRVDLPDTATNLFERAVDLYAAGVAAIGGAAAQATPVAVLHDVGITDSTAISSSATTQQRADAVAVWRTRHRAFIDALRARIAPGLPFVAHQIRPSLLVEARHAAIDDASRTTADEKPAVGYALAPTGIAYEKSTDSISFNAAGQRLIGAALFTAYDALPTGGTTVTVERRVGTLVRLGGVWR